MTKIIAAVHERVRRQIGIDWDFSARTDKILLHGVLLGSVLLICLPIIKAAIMSTQTPLQVAQPYYVLPGDMGVAHYVDIFVNRGMATWYVNTIIMATVIVVGKVVLSLLAALALVYYDFPYRRLIFFLILFTLLMPVPVRIVPLFEVVATLGWVDSMWAITIPYLASASATFLFYQHFRSMSKTYSENAKMDGISGIRFLTSVLIPQSKGMIAGISVITFIYSWNQYLWPLVALHSEDQQVVQVGIKILHEPGLASPTDWGLVMAAAVAALLPPLVVLLMFRRTLLETFGVK